jgi:3-isopropylmalate dehydratase small subunit
MFGHEMTDRDDDEDHHDNRQQIDLSGIVTAGPNFPAHCCGPPSKEDTKLTVKRYSGSCVTATRFA